MFDTFFEDYMVAKECDEGMWGRDGWWGREVLFDLNEREGVDCNWPRELLRIISNDFYEIKLKSLEVEIQSIRKTKKLYWRNQNEKANIKNCKKYIK